MITRERLKELVHYDPLTGLFTRLVSTGTTAKAGSVVRNKRPNQYIRIMVDGISYRGNRLAWLYVTGVWPTHKIDHRNTIRDDDRFENLRDVTQKVNCENHRAANGSKKLPIGVSFDKATGRFKSQIMSGGINFHLGRFDTEQQAHTAYIEEKRKIHKGNTL